MHANQLQKNMNHNHFVGQSNFLERHDNDLNEVGLLGASLKELLNLAQATE